MFLVKKATKPLGIGSIVNVKKESLDIYSTKKSGAFNDGLTGKKYIILGKINSCDQKILRVIEVYTSAHSRVNTSYFMAKGKARLTFLALSAIEDTKESYTSIFGEEGRNEVQEKLLNTHGISVAKI